MDKVKDGIKEKGLSPDDVYDHATWRLCYRTSTPHHIGNKMKEGKKKKKEMKHTVSLMSYLKNKTQSYVCMDV